MFVCVVTLCASMVFCICVSSCCSYMSSLHMCSCVFFCCFFFFKQKTAYEMRISDWSSDVCSSDLAVRGCLETLHGSAAQCQSRHQSQRRFPAERATMFQAHADACWVRHCTRS